ncbi:MAG: GNAT family N-acetyltransferase [Candidatus Heimdallarchaeota archaeon]
MIKQITQENFDDLNEIIADFDHFLQEKYNQPTSQLGEQLQDALANNTREILAIYNQQGKHITGIAVVNPSQGRITRFFVPNAYDIQHEGDSETQNVEKTLFDAAFASLRDKSSAISIGREFSNNLVKYMVNEVGFKQFERAQMTIEKETVRALAEPDLRSEYTFSSWATEMRPSIIELLHQSHYNSEMSIDASIFPQFIGIEGTTRLIGELEDNYYGQFKNQLTRVLKHNNEYIGVCFLTVIRQMVGYIPEISLLPAYRGKGLGKALLVHSLKQFFMQEPKIKNIDLMVTLSNSTAKALYDAVGFQDKRAFSEYIWNKKNSRLET